MDKTGTGKHYTVVEIPREEFQPALGRNSTSSRELDEWLELAERGRLVRTCEELPRRSCGRRVCVKERGR